MRVLVTGASGAIGSNLAKRLLELGYEVISIYHDLNPWDSAKALGIFDKISWISGNVEDSNLVGRILADYDIQQVYHLAALPIVETGIRSSIPIYRTNILGTLSILEIIKEQQLSGYKIRMLYLSTDKVYGFKGRSAYKETDPLRAFAPYENSKACADLICQGYAHTFDLDIRIIRSCNIYGSGDQNRRLIPNTIKNLINGKPARIWKDIDYTREFMYLDDLISALQLTMEKGEKGAIYNAGSGDLKGQVDVIDEILAHFPNGKTEIVEPPSFTRKEIQYQELDSSKIRGDLGWKTKYSFSEGIRRTVEWWKDYSKRSYPYMQ